MSLADELSNELGPDEREKKQSRSRAGGHGRGDSVFNKANGVDTLAVLDWLGIEHHNTARGEMAVCPGCGEDGALLCSDGGLKCLHDRCSSVGPSKNKGFRTNVDLVAHVQDVEPLEAANEICRWRGIPIPGRVERDEYEHTDADDPRAPKPEAKPAALPFVWVESFGDLHKPEPLRWLLRDRRTNKPFMRAGECGVLAGDGGVGKGFFWLQAAVSIALGRDLFDTFTPEQSGRVALLVAEDKQNEVHHRLHRIANALALDADEMQLVRTRIGVMPLSGQQVNLLAVDPLTRTPARTSMFDVLVKQLAELATAGGFEWSLVALDPLARFGSANAEIDQSAATMFVQTLETMAERLPGRPAIGVTHHSSAASVGTGRSNVRGVTGLRNAFRLAMVLDACETPSGLRGLLLTNDKNNLAPKADRLWLVRLDNEAMSDGAYLETAGVLRRATDPESKELDAVAGTAPAASREQREQAKATAKAAKFGKELETILECIPVAPVSISRGELLGALMKKGKPLSQHTLEPRMADLLRDGRVLDLSGGGKATARKYSRPEGA